MTKDCRLKKEGQRGKGTEDSPMRCKSALEEQWLEVCRAKVTTCLFGNAERGTCWFGWQIWIALSVCIPFKLELLYQFWDLRFSEWLLPSVMTPCNWFLATFRETLQIEILSSPETSVYILCVYIVTTSRRRYSDHLHVLGCMLHSKFLINICLLGYDAMSNGQILRSGRACRFIIQGLRRQRLWTLRQIFTLKRWYLFTILYGVASQAT